MSLTYNPQGSGLGAMMAGGNPNEERGRAINDFYATPDDVTRALVLRYGERLAGANVWEPCAGNGAMARVLRRESNISAVACSDIDPLPPVDAIIRIAKGDIFTPDLMARLAPDAVITNPPFSIAPRIIDYILGHDDAPTPFLALVLKATFWHASTRHALFLKHPPTAIHPLLWRPDFKDLGRPTMEIMWCVWDARAGIQTIYEPMVRPAPVPSPTEIANVLG